MSYPSHSIILCSVAKNLNAFPSRHPKSTMVAFGLISRFFMIVRCLSNVDMYGAFFDLDKLMRIAYMK